MAGKKQHFIPQLLLRGFKVPGQNRAELVVRYRRGMAQRQVSISDICHGKYFYSGATNTALDDMITQEERDLFGPALHALRAGQAVDSTREQILRRFIVHLSMRTQAARTILGETMERASQGFVDALTDPDVVQRMISSDPAIMKNATKKAIKEALEESGATLTRNQRRGIKKHAREKMDKAVAARYVAKSAGQYLPAALKEKMSAERIQRESLATDIAPPIRVSALDRLKVSLVCVDSPTSCLILGDDPVVGFDKKGSVVRSFLSFERAETYILPLTPEKMLALHDCPIEELPSAGQVNIASASLSREQFIGQRPLPEYLELVDRIGTHRDPLDDVDWKKVVSGETLLESPGS